MEYIGIDIAKRKFDLAWISEGRVRKTKVFENTPKGFADLLEWLSKQGIVPAGSHIAMEATSQYYEAVATFLHDAGYKVSVVNPFQIKAYGKVKLQRQKTDKADARLIATYCEQEQPMEWVPPPAEVRELQRLLARLEAVQDMLGQEQNRRYESHGETLESVDRIIGSLTEELKRLEKMIKDHTDNHPGLREQKTLLESIPGVGPRVSAYCLAWLRPERFEDARQAVAFVGLSPAHRESGDSVRGKPRLCKFGHARIRKALYMPALAAMTFNPAAQALSKRLKTAGKTGKTVVVAIMRKLVHWMIGVLKSGLAFDPQLALART